MSTVTPPRTPDGHRGGDTWPSQVMRYLHDVEGELSGIDPEEREDLLDELRAHIEALLEVEVLAHGDADKISLVRQIGTPQDFAAELLETAGLAPARPRRFSTMGTRFRSRAQTFSAVSSWLRQLAPVWWVARGYGLCLGLAAIGGAGPSHLVPVPWVLGNPIIGLAATAGAIYISVEYGAGRMVAKRGWRWMGIRSAGLLSAIALVLTLGLGVSTSSPDNSEDFARVAPFDLSEDILTLPGGEPVTNIYAFDRDGNALEDVLLYDGVGKPLVLQSQPNGQAWPFVEFGLQTDFQRDGAGQIIPNLYPLTQFRTGDASTGDFTPAGDGQQPLSADPEMPVPPEDPLLIDPVAVDPVAVDPVEVDPVEDDPTGTTQEGSRPLPGTADGDPSGNGARPAPTVVIPPVGDGG